MLGGPHPATDGLPPLAKDGFCLTWSGELIGERPETSCSRTMGGGSDPSVPITANGLVPEDAREPAHAAQVWLDGMRGGWTRRMWAGGGGGMEPASDAPCSPPESGIAAK